MLLGYPFVVGAFYVLVLLLFLVAMTAFSVSVRSLSCPEGDKGVLLRL